MATSSNSRDQRRLDIDENIKEILGLLKEYEAILVSPVSPDEGHNAKRRIAQLRELLTSRESELNSLDQPKTAAFAHEPLPDSAVHADLVEIRNELRQVSRIVEERHDILYQAITETHREELSAIRRLVEQGQIQEGESRKVVTMIEGIIAILQANQDKLKPELQESVATVDSALKSEASLQGKLTLTIPLIPMFLDYKVELAGTDAVNLNELKQGLQNWWKTVVQRGNKDVSARHVLVEYGRVVQSRDPNLGADPVRAAQSSLRQYRELFHAKQTYIVKFETKKSQIASNPSMLMTARGQLADLSVLSQALMRELERLDQGIEYPKGDLRRIMELADSVAGQAQSAANAVASSSNASVQLSQIMRNLPILRKIVEKVINWIEQMGTAEV